MYNDVYLYSTFFKKAAQKAALSMETGAFKNLVIKSIYSSKKLDEKL